LRRFAYRKWRPTLRDGLCARYGSVERLAGAAYNRRR
jgi:hypothetical protein